MRKKGDHCPLSCHQKAVVSISFPNEKACMNKIGHNQDTLQSRIVKLDACGSRLIAVAQLHEVQSHLFCFALICALVHGSIS